MNRELLRQLIDDEEQTLAYIEYEIMRTKRKLTELKLERDEHAKHLRDLRSILKQEEHDEC